MKLPHPEGATRDKSISVNIFVKDLYRHAFEITKKTLWQIKICLANRMESERVFYISLPIRQWILDSLLADETET